MLKARDCGEASMEDTEARFDDEVERFLRNGMLLSKRDGWDGDDGGVVMGDEWFEDWGEDVEDEELSDEESVREVFNPVTDDSDSRSLPMSPKYFCVSFSAVSCETPAKATTILSGLKNALRYFSTTSLLMKGRRSCGHNNGFPRVLSL